MRKRRGSVLLVALAVWAVGSALLLRAFITADPVLGFSELERVPSTILADAPVRLLLAVSGGAYGGGPFGGWSTGATVQVLDEDGRALRSVDIGQRPSQALVDPGTGHLFFLTASAPGASGVSFFSSSTYLNVVDPVGGMVLHSIPIQQPSTSGPGGFGGGGGGGGGFRGFAGGPPPPPSPWQVAYQYAMPRGRGGGALALDATRRRVFVGGGGYSGESGQADLVVLDADSGALVRTVPMPAAVSALAVDPAAARVFVADRSGTVTILDTRSLKTVGSVAGSSIATQIAFDARRGRVFLLAAGVSTVTTIDSNRRALLGVAAVGAGATGVQVDEQTGHVFVESTGVPSVGFGFLRGGGRVVSPGPGSVTMLDAGSGKVLRTIRVGTLPFGAALDGRHHQLFVGNFGTGEAVSGTVQVIDTARGVMQRTIAVPAGPFSLALDPVRGHVVVAGLGDQSQLHGAWPSAVERAAQLLGRDAPTPTPSSSPAGAVTILRAAR